MNDPSAPFGSLRRVRAATACFISSATIGQLSCVPLDGPLPPGLPFHVQSLSTRGDHTCALVADGSAYCWGRNDYGQVGDGSTRVRTVPELVAGGLIFMSIVGGIDHTCGVSTVGAAYCWGTNNAGQLGEGSTTTRMVPTAVAGGLTFQSVTIGGLWSKSLGSDADAHTCALTKQGAAYCWGSNVHGRLGDGTTTNRATPVAVAGDLTFQSLAAGIYHTCGLTTGGAAYCWGSNFHGSIGVAAPGEYKAPVAVSGGLTFRSLVSGNRQACGLTTGGDLFCWGHNPFGTNGTTAPAGPYVPRPVGGALKFQSVSASDSNVCGVTASGAAYCWGDNYFGQVGNGAEVRDYIGYVTPVGVTGGLSFSSIASGGTHTCGITSAGVAYCWGYNAKGQVGDGTTDVGRPSPIAVRAP